MKPYPAYKDSGIEWIGEIPEHWEISKAKYHSKIVLGKMLTPNDKGNYQLKSYLKAKNILWEKVDVSEVEEMWFSENEMNQYRLQLKDIVVSEGGEVGRTAIWMDELEECYIQNSVHKVTVNMPHNPRYFLFQFVSHGKRGYFDSIVSRVSIAHLTREKLKEVTVFVPSPEEQQSISIFLDQKTSQIDTLISKKQKQIELLKEERTAIINQAVTKGLNPDVPMKDSGIEWLGEVPEHWKVKRLKHLAHINPTKSSCDYSQNSDELVTFLPMEKVSEEGDVNSEIRRPINELWNGFTYFRENDIIVAKITPCFENGKGAILRNIGSKIGFGSTEFHVIHPKLNEINSMLLYYNTRTHLFRKLGEASMTGAAGQKRVPSSFIENYLVGVPNGLDEQQAIVDYIENECNKISQIMQTAEKQISFLQEYRTALISNAVTGKIDVRDTPTASLE